MHTVLEAYQRRLPRSPTPAREKYGKNEIRFSCVRKTVVILGMNAPISASSYMHPSAHAPSENSSCFCFYAILR